MSICKNYSKCECIKNLYHLDCYKEWECPYDYYDCHESNPKCYSSIIIVKYVIFIVYLIILIISFTYIFILTMKANSPPTISNMKSTHFLYNNTKYYYEDNRNLSKIYNIYKKTQKNNIDFDTINGFILIPIFTAFSLFFSISLTIFKRDILFYVNSQMILLLLKMIWFIFKNKFYKNIYKLNQLIESKYYNYYLKYEFYYNFNSYYKTFEHSLNLINLLLLFEFIVFFLLLASINCFKEIIITDNIKTKYLRCYFICYFIFCICALLLYINAEYFFPKCHSEYKEDIIKLFQNKTNFNKCEYCDKNTFIFKLYSIYTKKIIGYHKFINNTELNSNNYIHFFLSIICLPFIMTILIFFIFTEKTNNFIHTIVVLICEIISLILKLTVIFFPYLTRIYKLDIDKYDTSNFTEILDDYKQYEKCRNTFPMIIIVELILFIIDITINLNLFKDEFKNCYQKIKKKSNNNIKIIFCCTQLNKEFKLDSNIKNIFKNDIKKLILFDNIFEKYKIKKVVFSNYILYSENINIPFDNRTNKELGIINYSRIQIILNVIDIDFYFFTINDAIINIKEKVSEEELLYDIINNIKKRNKAFNMYNYDKIYGLKNKKQIMLNNNKIKELNLKEIDNKIYLVGQILKINLKLFWVTMKNKKFEMKIEITEKFHDMILKFISNNNSEFKYYIITEIYKFAKKSEIKRIKPKINEKDFIYFDTNNINNNMINTNRELIKTKKPIHSKKYNNNEYEIIIIENEDNYVFKTFLELDINEDLELYFETRDIRKVNKEKKKKIEEQKYKDFGPKMNNKQYLIFTTPTEGNCPLFLDENLKMIDALELFKKEYSFFDNEIILLYKGENFLLENGLKTIKQLNLNSKEPLTFIIKDISEIDDNISFN